MRELTIKEQMNMNGGKIVYWVEDLTTGQEWSFEANEYNNALMKKGYLERKGHGASLRKVNLDI